MPKYCEYPGCVRQVMYSQYGIGLTHNFDKIKNTWYQRNVPDWDYIFVCHVHWSGLRSKFWEHVDRITGGKSNKPLPVTSDKPKTWSTLLEQK